MRILVVIGLCVYLIAELWMQQNVPSLVAGQSLRMAVVIALCALTIFVDDLRRKKERYLSHAARVPAADLANKVESLTRKEEEQSQSLKEAETLIGKLQMQIAKLNEEKALKDEALDTARAKIDELLKNENREPDHAAELAVLGLVSMLQEKGRLVDFIMGDISQIPDAQIGAAARVVHQGLSLFLPQCFEFRKLHAGQEGETVALNQDYPAKGYRLLGNVPNKAPYEGRILHCGWQVLALSVPQCELQRCGDGIVITPAQVECR